MQSDIEIAQAAKLKPINEIAAQLNIRLDDLELYGKYKAKIPLDYINFDKIAHNKLILVTAINPTPAGEGKTLTSIGLTQGMNKIGKKTIAVLREPSLGPVFGIKGGATGGGYSQVLPMEDINLHFTGDLSAVEKAHNLLAALADNQLQNIDSPLKIDPRTVRWKRVMDMNDRSLRETVIGLGGTQNGMPRQAGFDITAASEVMATLCLSNDLTDLKQKLGNIYIGNTFEGQPVYARDLKANGAMAALLKDAIKPNLVQTYEGNPAIIHGGPFGNIAQGTNTIIATRMGLSLADYVVTEAGFATELGAEKFLDIKCRISGLRPWAVVLVATIRALKYHGGAKLSEINNENTILLQKGLENLEKHIENIKHFGITPVVAINRFSSDTESEIALVKDACANLGVKSALSEAWLKGGEGTTELAQAVLEEGERGQNHFQFLYDTEWTVEQKIGTIAVKLYGASKVEYTSQAKKDLQTIYKMGLGNLPICVAKTQKSLSDNPELRGRPRDFVFKIREFEIASGAGFLIPIAGDIVRMPGLPKVPAAENIDIDAEGNISGLF